MDKLHIRQNFLTPEKQVRSNLLKVVPMSEIIKLWINNGTTRDGLKDRYGIIRIDKLARDKLIRWLLQHQKEYP